MNFMKEQFLQTLSKDDSSMKSITSSQEQEDFQVEGAHAFADTILVGESKAPEEDESNFGDFWDSLTSMIIEKIDKEKDKKRKGKA